MKRRSRILGAVVAGLFIFVVLRVMTSDSLGHRPLRL
jgi:hypothetical protein